MRKDGRLVGTSRPLAPGRHRVKLVVKDAAGNKRTTTWVVPRHPLT